MLTKKNVLKVVRLLEEEYPLAKCTLDYEDGWQLLVCVRLAAQCTDAKVNRIAPALFEKYPTPESAADADISELEELVKPCGLYRMKARDIKACARELIDRFGGRVPGTMEELLSLPGVGRKTANLILGDLFAAPGAVVVDTHCIRLSNRIGLVNGLKDPKVIEFSLREVIPPELTSDFCHRLVMHGRAVCPAGKPDCDRCCLNGVCEKNVAVKKK